MTKVKIKIKETKANKIFEMEKKADEDLLNFDVPVLDTPIKAVPTVDPHYKFKAETLVPVLWALMNNKKAWLHGHTGTGKSTLISQVAARLNWPLIRVNFDSEISRLDLVGRDTLKKDEDGVTVSEFVDGVLPQALVQPCILLCDEVDFIRPDVAYVFQRALEDEGLLLSEDGGRLIQPHEHFRIIATANTQGQGDEHGIYQGARAQSMAFLDRFTVWVHCDYLEEAKERQLIKEIVPEAKPYIIDQVMQYVQEHRTAFSTQKVSQPLSPRTIVALTEASTFYDNLFDRPVMEAAKMTILSKANDSDKNVLLGIADRVAKSKPKPVTSKNKDDNKKLLDELMESSKKKSAAKKPVKFHTNKAAWKSIAANKHFAYIQSKCRLGGADKTAAIQYMIRNIDGVGEVTARKIAKDMQAGRSPMDGLSKTTVGIKPDLYEDVLACA